MSQQLPAPDFNSLQYERPNLKWVCGKAADGQTCRLGPDSRGHCRVAFACRPACETKPGESKGRYRCTRPAESGGPCAGGPLPDGTCCRPLAPCVPVRSLRSKRIVFTLCTAILTIGFLLVALCGPFRSGFISPGPLSRQHATFLFAHRAKQEAAGNCAVCHKAARGGPAAWLQSALQARPGPWEIRALAASGPSGMTAIDRHCLGCHEGHSFHEPNVDSEHSCSDCHVEHQGPGPMRAPSDASCLSCHANAAALQASLTKAASLPAAAFDYRPAQGRVIFQTPRPPRGYTRIIHTFSTDHPEFEIIINRLQDPDTLRFNHELHLNSPNISSLLHGRKLTCSDCHQPDAAGVHFIKITYQQNCRQCHALQFDVRNPGLLSPHGDAEHVRAFLRSLPQQYADDAASRQGIGDQAHIEAFAREQIARLLLDFHSGEELERRVFFNDARLGPVGAPGGTNGLGAAIFPGCAYCHQITPSASGAPLVTDPILPDRWMIHGNFDHSKHLVSATGVAGKILCSECHDVEHSRLTSDVLLPSKETCVQCHSPNGGVSESCSTCHSYHSPGKDSTAAR
jgi:hypothetical protein